MSVNKDLRWLRAPGLKGPAKRFADFCKTDIPEQSKLDPKFDVELYSEAAKLIIQKLQTPPFPENITRSGQK